MTEDEKRRWDVRLAVLGPLLTIVTIVVGVWQVNRESGNRLIEQGRMAQLQDDLEFRRKLWSDASQSCKEVTQLAARVAVEADYGSNSDELSKDWTARYWSVSLTLDPNDPNDKLVEKALIEFRSDLQDLVDGGYEDQISNRLKVHSHALGEACGQKIRAGSSEILRRANGENP